MKKFFLYGLLVMAVVFTACGKNAGNTVSKTTEPTEIVVSAAASLKDVTAEIAKVYESKNKDIKLTFTYGSSGSLQTQIEEGAPSDIFISAAKKQMNALTEKNLVSKDKVKELLENKIVLIVPKNSTLDIKSFEDCALGKVKTIAIGEPKSVPVGQYAEEVFKSLNILDKVKAKANYGTDVRQVLDWTAQGEVECGVVYATDAAIEKKVTVTCQAPAGSVSKVIYPAAVLNSSKNADKAQSFVDFLSSDEAAKIFEKYGFTMVK